MDLNLGGKVALVTGGNSGIGLAAATLFAKEGAKVVIAGRDRQKGEAAAASIRDHAGEAVSFVCDVSDAGQVEALIAETIGSFGGLDVAFNNAGVERPWVEIDKAEIDEWDATVDVNLKGVWLCCKYEVAAMSRRGGGSIVNCSSWQAYGGLPGGTPYCASKAGLDGLTRSLALEVGAKNIRVNNMAPGNIYTSMVAAFGKRDDPKFKPFLDLTPLGRFGDADECAAAAVWLASDAARFITGQTLVVDGGFAIPGPHHAPGGLA